jgi:signal peptidase II
VSAEAIGASTALLKARYLIVTTLVLALDQWSKVWVSRELSTGGEVNVIDGLLKLSYTENPGIAFGMLSNGNVKWLLVAVSVAAILAVGFYMSRTPASNRLLLWSLSLLAAGIAGNLIDRVRLGRVIDFIEIYYRDFHWPVFNIADSAITIGAALMAVELFLAPQVREGVAVAPADDGRETVAFGDGETKV